MEKPKRFEVKRSGEFLGYAVQFEGGRIVFQVYEGGQPGPTHPAPDLAFFLRKLNLEESDITWVDK